VVLVDALRRLTAASCPPPVSGSTAVGVVRGAFGSGIYSGVGGGCKNDFGAGVSGGAGNSHGEDISAVADVAGVGCGGSSEMESLSLRAETPKPFGLLARLGDHVDRFEERIQCGAGGGTVCLLRDHLRRSLGSASGSETLPATEFGGANFSDVGSHLRGFVKRRGWDTFVFDEIPTMDGTALAQESDRLIARSVVAGELSWERFHQACRVEGTLVRGWVCEHLEKHCAVRVRLVAVETPKASDRRSLEDGQRSSGSASSRAECRPQPEWGEPRRSPGGSRDVDEEPDWLVAPDENEGIFGMLRVADSGVREADPLLLPIGTLIRAVPLRSCDASDRRLLRACEANCAISLVAGVGPLTPCLPGILSREAFGADTEWPRDGATARIARDPRFKNRNGLRARARALGLQHMYASLLPECRRGPAADKAPGGSQGMQLSRLQGRAWADRRVRDGVSKARAGDQTAALERYDAALELCPRHKEALVGRGAALVNIGRLAEAVRDFDAALKLDPADSNATRYREIARRRVRDEGINGTAGRSEEERKRRRGASSSHVPLVVR